MADAGNSGENKSGGNRLVTRGSRRSRGKLNRGMERLHLLQKIQTWKQTGCNTCECSKHSWAEHSVVSQSGRPWTTYFANFSRSFPWSLWFRSGTWCRFFTCMKTSNRAWNWWWELWWGNRRLFGLWSDMQGGSPGNNFRPSPWILLQLTVLDD